jgi:endonuclease YncB( thermonuclease family)
MSMIAPHLAAAQGDAMRAASQCRPPTVATGLVSRVLDGRTFVLDDGREVRLAGIEVPADGAVGAPARRQLEQLLANATVVLKALGPERDRYGRVAVQVFVAERDNERWVQPELVAAGHARVSARVGDRACAAALLLHEQAARRNMLGLWSDPYYGLRRAEEPTTVAAERGRFAVVEGNVLSVRESGGTIYVNFGRRWSEAFTVTIAKRNERAFAAAGLEPKALAGRRVRVRGWIEERGGPWVEATRPEQIELMERN